MANTDHVGGLITVLGMSLVGYGLSYIHVAVTWVYAGLLVYYIGWHMLTKTKDRKSD